MGYSTPKKQLDLKEFLAQPASKPNFRNGMSFRKPGGRGAGSTVPKATTPTKSDAPKGI